MTSQDLYHDITIEEVWEQTLDITGRILDLEIEEWEEELEEE